MATTKRCVCCDRDTEHVDYDSHRLYCTRCASVTRRDIVPRPPSPRGADRPRAPERR